MRSLASLALGAASLIALVGSAGSAEAQGHARTPTAPTTALPPQPPPLVMPAPLSHASVPVSLAQLPQGQLLDPGWDRQPAAIPAAAKIADVHLVRSVNRYGGHSQVNIEVTDARTDDSPQTGDESPRADALCFGSVSVDPYRDERREQAKMRRRGAAVPADGSDEPARSRGNGGTYRCRRRRRCRAAKTARGSFLKPTGCSSCTSSSW